jgi:hypothetical protein
LYYITYFFVDNTAYSIDDKNSSCIFLILYYTYCIVYFLYIVLWNIQFSFKMSELFDDFFLNIYIEIKFCESNIMIQISKCMREKELFNYYSMSHAYLVHVPQYMLVFLSWTIAWGIRSKWNIPLLLYCKKHELKI